MKRRQTLDLETVNSTLQAYSVRSVLRATQILKSFHSTSEILELRTITARAGQNKATVFRICETLVQAEFLQRVGRQGYRLRIDLAPSRRYRIGYAAQSRVVAFTATVTDSLVRAASAANCDLLVLNNNFSPTLALRNADVFIREKVDLVIDSQIDVTVAAQLAAKFSDARIPFIAVDIPHPGAFYFGSDNYKAGRMAGRHLGRWAAKQWKSGVQEVLLIGANAAGAHLNARLHGMFDGMVEVDQELRNARCTQLDTKGQFEVTLDKVRKALRLRKLRRVLVGAINDLSALAGLQAFRDFGMEEECAIAGQDGCIEARDEMRRSSTRFVCTVAYYPEKYGEGLLRFATDILTKKPVPPAILTDHELITAENVNKIYPNDSWLKLTPRQ
jgi:ribose transport system substrate-binding protein